MPASALAAMPALEMVRFRKDHASELVVIEVAFSRNVRAALPFLHSLLQYLSPLRKPNDLFHLPENKQPPAALIYLFSMFKI
jgi:hypothetical protein